jgi:hypothetical protein
MATNQGAQMEQNDVGELSVAESKEALKQYECDGSTAISTSSASIPSFSKVCKVMFIKSFNWKISIKIKRVKILNIN